MGWISLGNTSDVSGNIRSFGCSCLFGRVSSDDTDIRRMSLPVISTEHKSLEMPRWLYYFLQKSAQTEDANKIFQSLHRVLFASHTKTGHESLWGRQLVDLYWEFRWSWVWFSPLILGSVSLKHVPKMFSNGIIDASISLRKLDLPLCLLMGPVRFIFWNFCNVRSHWKWWVTYIEIL